MTLESRDSSTSPFCPRNAACEAPTARCERGFRLSGETDLSTLLASLAPKLMEGEFVFCTLRDARYGDFAERSPIACFRESEGLTLVVSKAQAKARMPK